MEFTEKDIMECVAETSELVAQRQAAELGNVLQAAKQADVLANNVEFWKWIGENFHCLGSAENIQAVAMNKPEWLQHTVLQGKGYEWDFMTSQRQSFDKIFSRFDAGTSPTQNGIDITEYGLFDSQAKATYQNKAYTRGKDGKFKQLDLKSTPKDALVVTGKETVSNAQAQGYETLEFQDEATIIKQRDNRMEQAKNGKAVGQYTIKNVGVTMAKAGLAGAVIGMGTETIISFKRMKNGEITKKQYLAEIAKSGAQGGITGAASSGIMIPVQAALTAAGASCPIGIPIAIVVSAALDKIIAPAFGRGDYAKYLGQAKFYQSITDMQKPLIAELDMASLQFEVFVDEIAAQQQQFIETTMENRQLNALHKKGNEVLSDKTKLKALNSMIDNI